MYNLNIVAIAIAIYMSSIMDNLSVCYLSFHFYSWYFGTIDCNNAEKQLMQPFNVCSSFLVRDSKTTPDDYSLPIRDTEEVKHYKIRRLDVGGFFVIRGMTFESIPKLVQYYKMQADGLCVNLKMPCLISKKPQTAGLPKETNEAWEIDRGSIRLVKKLDAGEFAEVWQGIWNGTTEVAVKTLKPGTMGATEFLEEAAVMKKLRHPKLLQLYAVCTKEEPIYIITELMKHGSLLEYLRGDGRILKLPQLINMGAQVAAGMAYLEENNYVHRDLAARNILVSKNLICKVDVVSMARVLSDDMYKAYARAKFLIKWKAPEAAMYNHFTIKSDVWSFGILLYELITYGHPPYSGLNNAEVLEALRTGFCMQCPKVCPEQLYSIMRECWRHNAASRPTFESLHWRLEDFYVENEPTHFYLHEIQ